jgi:hypothetical protein
MGQEKYIPIEKCKNRHLYIISARNADIGVYIAEEKAFKISRFKFGSNFIDKEYHWDIEPLEVLPPPFPKLQGTAKPLEKLNFLGAIVDDDERLRETLNKYMKSLFYDIKKLKKTLSGSFEIISPERMRKLRILKGGA